MREDKLLDPEPGRFFGKIAVIGKTDLIQSFGLFEIHEIVADVRHDRSIIMTKDLSPSSQQLCGVKKGGAGFNGLCSLIILYFCQ